MQCRRPFGAAVPPFGGITRPPAGGGQASAGLAAGGNGAAGHGAAGTVPGGYGASIEARFHRARHLVPAKAGTVSRRHGVWCRQSAARFLAARLRSAFGGPALRGVRNPGGVRNSGGVCNPGGARVPSKACGPFGHAISQVRNLSKSASGGGDRRPDRAGGNGAANRRHGAWCRLRPARCLVPPNGAAQNRLAKARLKTGGGPAARRPDRAGGMVPPDWAARGMVPAIAGTEWCRAIARHEVWCRPMGRHGSWRHGVWCRLIWCRQSAARDMVPAKAGTVSCRALPSGAVIRAAFPGGQCRICFFAPGFWQGRRGSPAGGAKPCLPLEACAAGPIGPPGTVLPIGGPCWPGGRRGQSGIGDSPAGMRSLGMRSPGMRMSWSMRVSGNAEPGNADVLEHAEPGNADVRECGVRECGAWEKCGIRGLPAGPIGPAGTVPPDRAAQNGAAYWRHGAAA